MKIFNKLDRYLNEYEYKIIYYNNKLNISNYIEILDFTPNVVKIKHKQGISLIKGNNLVVSKMLDNEVLIEGKIISIDII